MTHYCRPTFPLGHEDFSTSELTLIANYIFGSKRGSTHTMPLERTKVFAGVAVLNIPTKKVLHYCKIDSFIIGNHTLNFIV